MAFYRELEISVNGHIFTHFLNSKAGFVGLSLDFFKVDNKTLFKRDNMGYCENVRKNGIPNGFPVRYEKIIVEVVKIVFPVAKRLQHLG